METIRYGDDPSQFAELTRAQRHVEGRRRRDPRRLLASQYDLSLGRPARGLAGHARVDAYNLEYRRVGNGGGWPTTSTTSPPASTRWPRSTGSTPRRSSRWGTPPAGTSAGARCRLARAPAVPVTAAVSQAGVLDLAAADRGRPRRRGRRARSWAVPTPYAAGRPDRAHDPARRAGAVRPRRRRRHVPLSQSIGYVERAKQAGADAELIRVDGDHFVVIDPRRRLGRARWRSWRRCDLRASWSASSGRSTWSPATGRSGSAIDACRTGSAPCSRSTTRATSTSPTSASTPRSATSGHPLHGQGRAREESGAPVADVGLPGHPGRPVGRCTTPTSQRSTSCARARSSASTPRPRSAAASRSRSSRRGAARMALEADVPIIPCIVWGSQRIAPKGAATQLGRTKTPVMVAIGEPIPPAGTADELTAALHAAMTRCCTRCRTPTAPTRRARPGCRPVSAARRRRWRRPTRWTRSAS